MRTQEINDELQSHIADLIDEYVGAGLSTVEAEQKAHAQFGDLERISKEIAATHHSLHFGPWLLGPLNVICGVLLLSALFATHLFAHSVLGTRFEYMMMLLCLYGTTALITYCAHLIIEYYGVRSPRVLLYVISWTMLAHISITTILDIDKFEAILHSLVVVSIFSTLVFFFWKKIPIVWLKLFLYLIPAGITLTAVYEHRLLNFVGKMKCLFITPDDVPLQGVLKSCTQVDLWSPVLWPIYIVGALSVVAVGSFMFSYRHTSGPRYRMIVLYLCTAAIVLTPIVFRDVNNVGALDIMSSTPHIYTLYQNALGRDPQDKDIAFYALTRSFEHMDRIENVLYTSEERKKRIQEIFQTFLQRKPTDEELSVYLNNRTPLQEIEDAFQTHTLTH